MCELGLGGGRDDVAELGARTEVGVAAVVFGEVAARNCEFGAGAGVFPDGGVSGADGAGETGEDAAGGDDGGAAGEFEGGEGEICAGGGGGGEGAVEF